MRARWSNMSESSGSSCPRICARCSGYVPAGIPWSARCIGSIIRILSSATWDQASGRFREDARSPKVVHWSHIADPECSIAYLADSFTEFLAMLEPDEPLPDD